MWCASCLQEVASEDAHVSCKDYMWRTMSEEYTKARLRMVKQQDPGVHKGETVELRDFNPGKDQE